MRILGLSLSALAFGALFVSSGPSLSGCVMPSSTSDAGSSSLPVTGGEGGLPASDMGTGCGSDPTTGVTLCTSTTACPSVTVDESVFPECGFLLSSGATYLVCLCSGYLCPIGAGQPTSCADAASLLAAGNQGIACGQASDGKCEALSSGSVTPTMEGGIAPTTTDSGLSGSSGCDTNCEAMCGGEPDCVQMCGC